MRIITCVQGSPEWLQARLGVVTASNIDRILTPSTLALSKQADEYMARLIAETLLGAPVDDASSDFMERGREMEPRARKQYEFLNDVKVEQVGFVTTDDGRIGCSPDGLIGTDGGLEIKIPGPQKHVLYCRKPEKLVDAYRGQVQMNLLVTERSHWDLMSYNPEIEPVVVRVHPNEGWRKAIGPVLEGFLEELAAAVSQMRGNSIPF